MINEQKRRLDAAQRAVGMLESRYRSPRRLAAALDIVAKAIGKLPRSLTRSSRDLRSLDLCAILEAFAREKLVSNNAIISCRELDDLAETADYDDPDEDEFADECEGALEVLNSELTSLLQKLRQNARA